MIKWEIIFEKFYKYLLYDLRINSNSKNSFFFFYLNFKHFCLRIRDIFSDMASSEWTASAHFFFVLWMAVCPSTQWTRATLVCRILFSFQRADKKKKKKKKHERGFFLSLISRRCRVWLTRSSGGAPADLCPFLFLPHFPPTKMPHVFVLFIRAVWAKALGAGTIKPVVPTHYTWEALHKFPWGAKPAPALRDALANDDRTPPEKMGNDSFAGAGENEFLSKLAYNGLSFQPLSLGLTMIL